MTPLRRIAIGIAPFFVLGACAQLIGLSDYERGGSDETDGGESQGGRSGRGGTSSGGADTGGVTGMGGTGKGGRGGTGPGGEGGIGGEAGEGGEPGAGQGGTTGGGGMGGAGMSGGGAGGSGGSPPCTEITIGAPTDMVLNRALDGSAAIYAFDITPEFGLASVADILELQFWNGGSFDGVRTGTFPLDVGRESNYSTCSRCLVVRQDESGSVTFRRDFFQTSGTMTIAPTSQQFDGFPDLVYADVTLREVTIDPTDFHSTIVPGGACMHITSASYSLPPSWNCPPEWENDVDCDCGCGVFDTTCVSNDVSSCDLCWCDDSGDCTGVEKPISNWMCQ